MSASPDSVSRNAPDAPTTESVRVAILGAGMSGICMGIALRKQGIDDFVMLEKADSVGGTWRENTYPGVACDVPSHVYSFSFELNPNWSHAYSSGREIRDYCDRCVDKYALRGNIRFGCNVTNVAFDGDRWHVATQDGRQITADVVVSGLGGLHIPNRAAIAGIEVFRGARFHTAQWDHAANLAGRRVAIIGTGASGVQVLPEVAKDAADVTVFQRSAAWVFPRLAHEIPEQRRALFRRMPWLMRLYRWGLWLLMDVAGTLSLRRNSVFGRQMKRAALAHLDTSVDDPALRARLTPDYLPGCKRRCISDDYLSSFNRANVHLVTEPIEKIEATGVRDAAGHLHEVDTIIEATGFKPFDITDYVNISGRDGRRLKDVWSNHVESFRTVMVPGFPEFLHAARAEQRHRPHLGADHDRIPGAVRGARAGADATSWPRLHRSRSRRRRTLQRTTAARHAQDGVQRRLQCLVHRWQRSQLHAVAVLRAALPCRTMGPQA